MDPRGFGRCPSTSATSSSSSSTNVPARGTHRRAHSETFLRLPDDLLLLLPTDAEDDFPSLADLDLPSFSDDSAPPPASLVQTPTAAAPPPVGDAGGARKRGGAHLRSLSVDAALFERLGFESSERGSHAVVDEADSSLAPLEFPKKAMATDKLAELALIDPKRAKRILANRQSAARSKERKVRYTGELEKKVQTLQTEATTLSAQVTLLQKDTSDLTVENKELKLRLEAMEQQAHLRDALNEALREEVQRLKIATGQIPAVNGNAFGLGLQQQSSPYFSQLQQLRGFPTSQTAQLDTSQLPSDGRCLHDVRSSFDAMDLM